MAKMEAGNIHAPQQQSSGAMDNLTKKVNEMRVHAVRAGHTGRGRGRGGRSGPSKIEVPDADFDFASANAKFNKDDIVKEAIAGSPSEAPNGSGTEVVDTESAEKPASPQAYDKKKSFFDNISSEAKDRAEGSGQKAGGREWRGEEQRKNIETFGQGSVDGGFRNNYRGRGRGRGGRGRGYQGGYQGRGGGRGGNFRPRDGVTSTPSAPQ
jgi:protein LSM14